MSQTALVRITGKVLALPEPRSGISKVTGEPWEIATANVLVANQNVTVVQLPRISSGIRRPKVGEIVDLLCETSVYQTNVQNTVLGWWEEQHSVEALQLADSASVSM